MLLTSQCGVMYALSMLVRNVTFHLAKCALLVCVLCCAACFDQDTTLRVNEDGSCTMVTTLLTDLPVQNLASRNPEWLKATEKAFSQQGGTVKIAFIQEGGREGLRVMGVYETLESWRNAWPLCVTQRVGSPRG